MSLQQVRHYESAASSIPPSRLYLFARSLGVPVAWFFDDLPPAATGRTEMPVPERQLESRETEPLVEAYCRIADTTRRRAVYRQIQSMAGTRGL